MEMGEKEKTVQVLCILETRAGKGMCEYIWHLGCILGLLGRLCICSLFQKVYAGSS